MLLDFGAIQPYPYSGPSKPGKVSSSGFSPIEQYTEVGGTLGPWSDIYALGASMRMFIEGKAPPPSKARAEKDSLVPAVKAFRRQYSLFLLEAIDAAMLMNPKDRPQSAQAMIDALRVG